MNEDLCDMLKYLRLNGLLGDWNQTLERARKGRFSHARLLTEVVEAEYRLKHENARQYRIRRAHIPEELVMETYPFQKQPKLNRKALLTIYDAFDYMANAQNIIWVGPTGCGKTGLASAFLIDAINRGHSGRFVTFAELVGDLRASGADYSEAKMLKHYLAPECLLIDELGYIDIEPAQVGLFFTLMQRRHRNRPTLITSNLGFDDWRSFLKNDHLTVALIDRLTSNSYVFNMKECRSLRPEPLPIP
jgi:DNA replication protein DnaC